jgi:lysozyme
VTYQTPPGKRRLQNAIGGATAAGLLLTCVATFEGKRNDPYDDLIGKATVCYGETNVAMRHYTDAECTDMLAGSLSSYVAKVHQATPGIQGAQLVAATSLAYNVGPQAYARSSVARLFNTGRMRDACDAFLRFSYAGGRQVAGLLKRRQSERAICLKGVS